MIDFLLTSMQDPIKTNCFWLNPLVSKLSRILLSFLCVLKFVFFALITGLALLARTAL